MFFFNISNYAKNPRKINDLPSKNGILFNNPGSRHLCVLIMIIIFLVCST